MDNQHATPTELAWLAGFMDGEGSIMIHHWKTTSGNRYSPRVSWANTDPAPINHADTIVRKLGIVPRVYEQNRDEAKKNIIYVQVNKMGDIRMLLEALLPYLVGRRARAELMLKYVKRRIEVGYRETEHDEMFDEMKTMNRRGAVRD